MKKRVAIAVLLVAALGALVPAVWTAIRAQTGLQDAEELLAHELWPQARERLASYLWLHPHDAEARLLLADAFAKDVALPADEAATQAIDCLAQIPDSSPQAAEARLRQGGFCFLILQAPGRGEAYLRESIELGGGLRTYQLLWTLLNFTGRSEDTEDVFWRVYELSSVDERPLRLQEWYMNQFSSTTAYEYLDRQLGVLEAQESPTRTSESRRYVRFREREPECLNNHVAVAQWCQEERDPQFAIRILDAAAKQLPDANSNPFFLSVSIATHLDLGQFDEAQACFRRWPETDRGHAYWKWNAIILDDVLGQHAAAQSAYKRALELWPGPADWRLHHRQAACLARLKKTSEAAAVRDHITQLKSLLTAEEDDRLQTALGALNDPEQLAALAKFYRQLGRNREADCWEDHIQRMRVLLAKSR